MTFIISHMLLCYEDFHSPNMNNAVRIRTTKSAINTEILVVGVQESALHTFIEFLLRP